MILYSFIIPIITCVILYIKFRKETVWWEYFAVFIPSILASGLLYLMFQAGRTSDIKFESYRVVSIRHYDKWDDVDGYFSNVISLYDFGMSKEITISEIETKDFHIQYEEYDW